MVQSFNPEAKCWINGSMGDFLQAEGAVDEAGPTQEFLWLLMMAPRDSTLFAVPQNSKNLSLDSHG